MTGTTVSGDDIIAAGRAISLTGTVVAEWAGRGTPPKQREYLHGFLTAEHASRTHARHARLLKPPGCQR